ncbi:MAG: hypothetical protein OXD49_08410 [Candidatus Poribacteria bacterium]|nr:hypothetical protein [Candidatus Poribacteria bacterium]
MKIYILIDSKDCCGGLPKYYRDCPLENRSPYTFEVRVLEGKSIDGYLNRGAQQIDDRTVSWHTDDLCALSI